MITTKQDKGCSWVLATLLNIGDGVIAVNSDGKIHFINHAATKLLGLKREDCLNKDISKVVKIIKEQDSSKVENPVFSAIKHKNTIRAPFDIFLINSKGKKISVGCKATPIYDDKKNPIGATLMIWDVTLQKKARQELQQAQEELEKRVEERTSELANAYEKLQETQLQLIQSEKMSALGRFSSGIAHEIKNPLSIIISGISFLQMQCPHSALFSKEEFSDKKNPLKLLESLKADGYVKKFDKDHVASLNKLLCIPTFYDFWIKRNKKATLPREVLDLAGIAYKYRRKKPEDLFPAELCAIQFLNRMLLEFMYPGLCPKNKVYYDFITPYKIKDAAFRADTIVKNLLKFSKPSKMEKQKSAPEEIVEYALANIPPDEITHVKIEKDYEKGLSLSVDRNQLVQVLINIITNSAQSISRENGNGTVKIRICKSKKSKISKSEVCLIEVEDNGVGIDKENLSRIFEPFFTTKVYNKSERQKLGIGLDLDSEQDELHGTGLGLSVSKTIINNHGGDIHIGSKPGKGTIVKITLPLV
jgi:PAS domain S-box-containing protein